MYICVQLQEWDNKENGYGNCAQQAVCQTIDCDDYCEPARLPFRFRYTIISVIALYFSDGEHFFSQYKHYFRN